MRGKRLVCAGALLALVLAGAHGPASAADAPIRVEVDSQFGAESKWTEPFVAAAAKTLVGLMANPEVTPPAVVHVQLRKDAKSAGVGGWATTDGIGFASDAWPEDATRLWIVAHELTNHFTALYAGGGGFPSDWWSDGRSPFPEYVSCLVLDATGHPDAAKWRRGVQAKQPDHQLFWKLHERYGFSVFAKFLRMLRADRVDLGKIGAAWPSPDRARSAYAVAYLSAAAGTNLAALVRDHGIGGEPSDWPQRHPEIRFVPYEVTAADVNAVLAAREWLFGKGADAGHHEALRHAFRSGGAMNAAPATSSISFTVTSAFGESSAWVRPFLERASRALVDRIGGADRAPPAALDVRLDEDRAAGGIGGGPEGASLHYVSNVWPQEQFRVWILTRDMGRLLFDHYGGGGLPVELWTSQAFGDVLAAATLRDVDQSSVADWIDKEQATGPQHALVRKLATDHGWKLFATFLKLLRDDKIDLAKIGAKWPTLDTTRALYAVAYLSLAAGQNLAGPLRESGLGRRPADWDARAPGTEFVEYEITEAEVARVMQRRDALFAHEAPEDARVRFRSGDVGGK